MRRGALLVALCTLGACTSSLGSVKLLAREDDGGVKLLRPGAVGRSCRTSIFGVSLADGSPALDEALAQIHALDAEGDVVTNAEVLWQQFVTGVYNHRCVVVRGDLCRVVPTLVLPTLGGHHH